MASRTKLNGFFFICPLLFCVRTEMVDVYGMSAPSTEADSNFTVTWNVDNDDPFDISSA